MLARIFVLMGMIGACGAARGDSPYATWKNGPPGSEEFFPIAVWLQSPANAGKYQAIGINVYVALWRTPTVAQLDELKKHDIRAICHFRPELKDNPTIIGWMHGDEPDNAQSLGQGKGYGPPILPEKIVADYQRIREADPTRPVMLNLGQGVAYDNYIGRGVRRGKLEDYPKYVQGCDIVSFDIYPVVHDAPEIAENLWYVPRGVTRLREWTKDQKIVWNCIETTHISNEKTKATPRQVRAEVWMSLIHGSRGLIYFAHEFKPKFIEAGLLADPEMSKAVGEINAQIKSLAPALNSAPVTEGIEVESSNKEAPIAWTARRHGGKLYLFAVSMREGKAQGTIIVKNASKMSVLGESRTLEGAGGVFRDSFKDYEVHLYEMMDAHQ
jgi:hypothetical protein